MGDFEQLTRLCLEAVARYGRHTFAAGRPILNETGEVIGLITGPAPGPAPDQGQAVALVADTFRGLAFPAER